MRAGASSLEGLKAKQDTFPQTGGSQAWERGCSKQGRKYPKHRREAVIVAGGSRVLVGGHAV